MTQQTLTGQTGGAFTGTTRDLIESNFTDLYSSLLKVGDVFYLDPANGSDNNDGLSPSTAVATLSVAYNLTTSGKNDVVVLMGDGTTSATARLSAAFTWSKNATHLVGIASPVLYSLRARIATTGSDTAFTPFFTVSGNGCIFRNIQWWHGFDTGTTSQINMVVTGSRNYFRNCHFAGMGDQESADSAGSRSLKIGSGGSGENLFEDCVVGIDTVTRGAANASIEFAGATPRNVFRRCVLPFMADASTPLGIIGTGSGNMDRNQLFEDCSFINAVGSTSSTLDAAITLAASSGGLILLKNCTSVGFTDWATDSTTEAQVWIDGAAPTNNTSGLAVNVEIT